MNRRLELDAAFLVIALLIAAIGVAGVASAGGPSSGLALRQGLWIALGLVALVVLALVDYRFWQRAAPAAYAVAAAALVVVLLFGHRVNGSKSWIVIGGTNLGQPSEFMKLGTVVLLARVMARPRASTAGLFDLATLGATVGFPMALVLLQPDMGTALTFAALLGCALFVVGLSRRTWLLLLLCGLASASLGWSHVLKPYQKERIRTFLEPETDPQATGYQIIQSRIAIGSGGLLGKGYAAGTQSQLNFIPEKHTDFVFPVVAEEWGFAGAVAVLVLYLMLVGRGLRIAIQARDAFGAYVVLGIMAVVATHVLVNLGMVTGLLPTIGIPLPLMSYGGSSMVSTLAGIGLVLSVRMRRTASA